MEKKEKKEKTESQKSHSSGKTKKRISIIVGILLLIAVCCISAAKVLANISPTAQTAVKAKNSEYLINSKVGRYQLKMTGNVSYYTTWKAPWTDLGGLLGTLGDSAPPRSEILKYYSYPAGGNEDIIYQNKLNISKYPYGNGALQTYTSVSYNENGVSKVTTPFDPKKIEANSSVANLDLGGGSVHKAYLVWYVRDDNNKLGFANKSVDLYFNGNNKKSVTAEKARIDVREAKVVTDFDEDGKEVRTTQKTNSYLCMAADVTDYVRSHGAGTYGVANIPYWYQTKATPNGGASIGAWQLVVVAEKEDWNVRSVSLKMGSTFMGTDSTGEYSETIKSSMRSAKDSSGQIFISGLYGNNGTSTMVSVTANKSVRPISSNYLSAGMINGDYPVGSSPSKKSSFFSAVNEIGNMGTQNTEYYLKVNKTTSWDTYFCLGMSVDADVPKFEAGQQTTYNAVNKTVTVTGKKTNTTDNSAPKVYDGRLVVNLDGNLTNATNIAFTVKNPSGTVIQSGGGTYNASNNTVTFAGINSATKGDVIEYSITCNLRSDGILEVANSDEFFGKVQYGTTKTGIEVPLKKSNSSAGIAIHVTLDSQGDKIDGGKVTTEGTKDYYIRYGTGSFADGNLTTPISSITVPTKKHCTFMGYYTAEDGGTPCIDQNGTILDVGKAFTVDTTLYAHWSPAVFTITLDAQRSDGALTNASSRTKAVYSKYHVGLFADANCTVPINRAVLPTSNGEICLGYWSVPNGSTMGANAAQYVENNGNLLQGAGTFDCKLITKNMTIYADWQSKNYTINCNVNTSEGIFDYGTKVFYEEYGKRFTFTQKNTDLNNMKTKTFSFNGSKGTAVGSTKEEDKSGVNGEVQTFTAPYTGWYYFEVWGAQGGKGYGTAGGKGGYSAGWKRLAQGAKIYVYVGGRGGDTTTTTKASSAEGGSENKGAWLGTGGYNGGKAGAGYADWWGVGAGGGTTDIRIGGKDKDNRVIAGGGGGGGASTSAKAGTATAKTGGAGGSKTYYSFLTKNGKFTGETEKRETDYEDKKELSGKYYGDGGGYPGGSSTKGSNAHIKTGQGGDNYYDDVKGLPSAYANINSCKNLKKVKKSGEKEGHGKAVIHYFNYSENPGVQTNSIYIPERKDGRAFAGYFAQPSGGTQIVASNGSIVVPNTYFNDSNTINGQATIYARWVVPNTYYVHYEGNGGDASAIPDQTCLTGQTYYITEQIPVRPGYVFMGWGSYPTQKTYLCYPNSWGRGNSSFTNLVAEGQTKTFYAIWARENYTIHFHPNGGGGAVYDMKCNWHQTYTYPTIEACGITPPIRNGKPLRFVGWSPYPNSASDIRKPGTSFINAADITTGELTLYAMWTSDYYYVEYIDYKDLEEDNRFTGRLKCYNLQTNQNYTLIATLNKDGKQLDSFTQTFTANNYVMYIKLLFSHYNIKDVNPEDFSVDVKIKRGNNFDNSVIVKLENIGRQDARKKLTQTCNYDTDYTSYGASQMGEADSTYEAWYSPSAILSQKDKVAELKKIATEIAGYKEQISDINKKMNKGELSQQQGESQIQALQNKISNAQHKQENILKQYVSNLTWQQIVGKNQTFRNLPNKSQAKPTYEYNSNENILVAKVSMAGFINEYRSSYVSVIYHANGAPYNGGVSQSQTVFTVVLNQEYRIKQNMFNYPNNNFITWSTKSNTKWNDICGHNGQYIPEQLPPKLRKPLFNPNTIIRFIEEDGKVYAQRKREGYSNSNSENAWDDTTKVEVVNGELNLYAVWQRLAYHVTLHAGTGIESVSGGGDFRPGQPVSISATTKTGYHWLNWTGNAANHENQIVVLNDMNATFIMPQHDVDLTANGEANKYTIRFDPNGGNGNIPDIIATYDTDVVLPDATDIFRKYTFDGVNVTNDVVSGVIPESLIRQSENWEENGEDEEGNIVYKLNNVSDDEEDIPIANIENNDTDNTNDAINKEKPSKNMEETDIDGHKAAHSLKKAYKSVFLGWALYDNRNNVSPQWKAGDVVRNLTAENNAVVTLYAVWDDCPWITATDLYYTLGQAQSGDITVDEIMSHATARDREDGSPILPGVHPSINRPEVNTSFLIPDYQENEFKNLTHDAAVSENLTVTDSIGNVYQKQIMIYIVDTTPQEVKPKGVTRFINEKYFNAPFEHGGLEDNSIWKNNSEYKTVLQSAFEHLKNDTYDHVYSFTQEEISEMKTYVSTNGVGNTKGQDALQNFYELYMR